MKTTGITTHKFERGVTNEDSVLADKHRIAVSDGAGGGGVYADLWSAYLLSNLPKNPISTADELDAWIGSIWERFYNDCEVKAKEIGGMLLNKFYDEGSFATLVAVWKSGHTCHWMSYGDSVAFHYNKRTRKLEHSFTELKDFNAPPFLINCKDELNKEGFRHGVFNIDKDSVVFVASDTLSHYLLMSYELSNPDVYGDEIRNALNAHTKNSQYIKNARMRNATFYKDILKPLRIASKNKKDFRSYIEKCYHNGWIGHDDYSFACF
jgi:hypothetical protein